MKNISFPTVKLGIVVRHFFFNFIRVYSSSNNIQRKVKGGESKPTVDDLKKKCQKEQNLKKKSKILLIPASTQFVMNIITVRSKFYYSSNRFQGWFHFFLSNAVLHPALQQLI